MRRQMAAQRPPARLINIDWAGLKHRTKQLTRMPFPVLDYAVSPDNHTLVFATVEPAGQFNTPVIYSVQDDGRRLTRITSGAAPGGEGGQEPPTPGGGGFRGGISGLNVSRDGRTLFFKEGEYVYSVAMPQTAATGGAGGAQSAAASAFGGAARRRINFVAKVKIDHPAEWAQMFDDAWRTMKYRFYDPKMHGMDWDAARAKYRPLVEYVGDRQELLNIINEMIGELNASHTGAAPPPERREPGAVLTGHLGVDLEPDSQAGRYRVTYIYEDGPADKDWVKVSTGDYLIAINGTQVKAGDNYWPLLNPQGRRHLQQERERRRRLDDAHRADLDAGLRHAPLRTLGEGAPRAR
jgi:tricorn protease